MLHYTVKKLPTSCWNNLSTRNISGTKQQRAARKRDNKSRNARLRGIYIVDGRIDTWIKSFIIGNESRTNRVQSGNTGKTMLPHTKELWARESFPFRDRETTWEAVVRSLRHALFMSFRVPLTMWVYESKCIAYANVGRAPVVSGWIHSLLRGIIIMINKIHQRRRGVHCFLVSPPLGRLFCLAFVPLRAPS